LIHAKQNMTAKDAMLLHGPTTADAGKKLLAGTDLTVDDGDKLTGNGTLLVEATAGTATFGGEVETLAGDLDLTAGTLIRVKQNMTAADAMHLRGATLVDDGRKLSTGGSLNVGAGKMLTAAGDLTLEATGGVIEEAGDDGKSEITMAVNDKTLSFTQDSAIDMAILRVHNSQNTHLVADSGDYVSVVSSDDNPADAWRSITATAGNGLALSGGVGGNVTTKGLHAYWGNISAHSSGDLLVNESVTADAGSVTLISENGKIYTSGAQAGPDIKVWTGSPAAEVSVNTLNVPISGYSDEPAGTGLMAIKLVSKGNLALGDGATLDARGSYHGSLVSPYPVNPDERPTVVFLSAGDPTESGYPIDVAIYVQSKNLAGNVAVGSSTIKIAETAGGVGTLILDAGDTVAFTPTFESSLGAVSVLKRIEVVSRFSQDLATATGADRPGYPRLPHTETVDDPEVWYFTQSVPVGIGGTYVMRGTLEQDIEKPARILGMAESAPLAVPAPLEPLDLGDVDEPTEEEDLRFLEEEGLKPHLAGAYEPSLSTSVELKSAVRKLRKYRETLRGTTEEQIAGLTRLIREAQMGPDPEEQLASFRKRLWSYRGQGTRYLDLGGEWLDALAGYVEVLNREIGLSLEMSVVQAMTNYGNKRLAGEDDRDFIRAYLVLSMTEAAGG
ncbi:MAG: hypothetical protein JSU94_04225, partial [Phycisphaerales bacterium]